MTGPAAEVKPVSMPEVMSAVARLQAAVDALAAVGARAAASEGGPIPAEVDEVVDAVLAAAGVPRLDDLPPQARLAVGAWVRSAFAQATDLLERSERPPGWAYTDVALLEGQGRGSMSIATLLDECGELGEPGSFLDVGTGVGWLAVGAATTWPACTIVGIDIWEPSIQRARANIAAEGLADRIEIRHQDVVDLTDRDRFDLTWLPTFFIGPDRLDAALERILLATRPGGRIVAARYDAPPDDLARQTLRLRTVRDGGSWLDSDELVERLTKAGWSDVRVLPKEQRLGPVFVVGSKP